ncbi:hypothetical protein, partial [Lactiplantibacillus pentosus]|uniref:hypothetical protein n=1 Tax=Lactiplantibacillus pentosus TaxID=1589 RepID=UPI001CDCBD44
HKTAILHKLALFPAGLSWLLLNLRTGIPRSMQHCRNVFGSDWDFRLATPERQAESQRLTL